MNCPFGGHEMTAILPGVFWCEDDKALATVMGKSPPPRTIPTSAEENPGDRGNGHQGEPTT